MEQNNLQNNNDCQKKKVADCYYCQNYRCCIDHCCQWEGCNCGDCQFCGNSKLKNLLTKAEIQKLKEEQLSQNKQVESQNSPEINSNLENIKQKDYKKQEQYKLSEIEIFQVQDQQDYEVITNNEKLQDQQNPIEHSQQAIKEQNIQQEQDGKNNSDLEVLQTLNQQQQPKQFLIQNQQNDFQQFQEKSKEQEQIQQDDFKQEQNVDQIEPKRQIVQLQQQDQIESKPKTKEEIFIQSIQKTQQDTQKALDSAQQTLDNVEQTMIGVEKTTDKIDEFERTFSKMNSILGNKLQRGGFFSNEPLNALDYESDEDDDINLNPEISDIETVGKVLMKKKNIHILSGDQISPEMQSDNKMQSTWEYEQKFYSKDKILSKGFFQNKNDIFWKWYEQERLKINQSQIPESYFSLAKFKIFLSQKLINTTFSTTSYAGLHIKATEDVQQQSCNIKEETKGLDDNQKQIQKNYYDQKCEQFGFYPSLSEIGGNINFLRCQNVSQNCENFGKLVQYCEKDQKICKFCQQELIPHLLFSDEKINEEYFRCEFNQNNVMESDCIILVGIKINSSYLSGILADLISRGVQIIEIGEKQNLEIGNIKQLIGNPNEIIPNLLNQMQNSYY